MLYTFRNIFFSLHAIICVVVLFFYSTQLLAVNTQQKKVVLQLTDNSQQKQILILNVANNLLKQYDKNIELEVVAFGPGLQLLFNESEHNQRISKLAKRGVKFSACRNTYKKMEKALGKDLKLNEYAKETDGGAARILELVEQGYILLRP